MKDKAPDFFPIHEEIQIFQEMAGGEPYIIAACRQDDPLAVSLDEIRMELNIDNNVKIITCSPKDKSNVIDVLLNLLDTLPEFDDKDRVTDFIRAL